jgi:hypothetical protein
VEPPGKILELSLEYWSRLCDLLGDPANFQKVRTVANALLTVGELDAREVRRLMETAQRPRAFAIRALRAELPEIKESGARLLRELHGEYLSPSGMRLGSHVSFH